MKTKKRGSTLQEIIRHKARLRKHACSEPWVEAKAHHNHPYPPKADLSPMLRCDTCETYYPGYYVTITYTPVRLLKVVTCEDCRIFQLPAVIRNQLPASNLASLLKTCKTCISTQ